MRGIVEMKVTIEMMERAFMLYWRDQYGYSNNKSIPKVLSVTQSKDRTYFTFKLQDPLQ